ncbi:hypothetical protein JYT85_02895 [Desulfocapsa sp. AH-315-G09]|nr:hypothetical protein [Desulfocapsa sp.]MBN4048533.1 hypothetical protein [bacterium AH-315-N22]MBN4065577.1 hypothetical protein [Desulfocapsa sp. AH-315-G09]
MIRDYLTTRDLDKKLVDLREKQKSAEGLDNSSKDLLNTLTRMSEEIPDWADGVTLIPDSEWVEYVQAMVEGISGVYTNLPRYVVINWEATAAQVQEAYTYVEYDDVAYWYKDSRK